MRPQKRTARREGCDQPRPCRSPTACLPPFLLLVTAPRFPAIAHSEACETGFCICRDHSLSEFLESLKEILTNKQRRYRAYRFAAYLLEYGRREKLPPCIKNTIKQTFPGKNDSYVGNRVRDDNA